MRRATILRCFNRSQLLWLAHWLAVPRAERLTVPQLRAACLKRWNARGESDTDFILKALGRT